MLHTFYIAPTGPQTGLTSIAIGLALAFDRLGLKVAVFKPVTQFKEGEIVDRSSQLIAHATGTQPPKPMSLKYAQEMMSGGQSGQLMEEVIALHREVKEGVDVVIVEGVGPNSSEPYTIKLNVDMAKTLDAEVILVTAPLHDSSADLSKRVEIASRMFGGKSNPKLLGCIINKINPPADITKPIRADDTAANSALSNEAAIAQYQSIETSQFKLIGMIPWNPAFVAPRTIDVANYLNAEVTNVGRIDQARVMRIAMCAHTMPNTVSNFRPGSLVVTPGDRDDILVAVAVAANNGVPLAGVLLTGGLEPHEEILKLLEPIINSTSLPILRVKTGTYQTASQLSHMEYVIPADDIESIGQVMSYVADCLDDVFLTELCKTDHEVRLSPAAFRYQLVQLAKSANKRVVLPEGDEPRTIQAAAICQERGIARCVLLGKREIIQQIAESQGITLPEGLEIIDPDEVRENYIPPMMELRKHKSLSAPMAEAQLEDTVVLGTMMLATDEVDGLVSGAVHTTANTIRPALQLIKTAPNAKLVSSVFFMLLPEQVMVYGDCAVNPNPTAEELADIALQSADSAAALGIPPKVAMISYSTGGSGAGSDVEKVIQATAIAKEKRPDLLIDGPLQYDAATTPSVAKSKAPDSAVAGQATVLIFPDLNTGNTTYKAVQRSANVVSVGPMLQGLNKPVNDLSRGALVEDIVYTIALTAIQADRRNS